MESLRVSPMALFRCVLTVLVAVSVSHAPAWGADPEEQAKNMLVLIESEINGEQHFGAGMIFAHNADRLYIATANHVVRQGLQAADRVRLRLRFLPGETVEAKLLENVDRDLDLAVIAVVGVKGKGIPTSELNFDLLADTSSLQPGMDVSSVGYPGRRAWYTSQLPQRLSEIGSSAIRFEATWIEPGLSGGGLFDPSWRLIGMVVSDSPPVGMAIPASQIHARLRQWGYPVDWKQTRTTPQVVHEEVRESSARPEPQRPSARPESRADTGNRKTVLAAAVGHPTWRDVWEFETEEAYSAKLLNLFQELLGQSGQFAVKGEKDRKVAPKLANESGQYETSRGLCQQAQVDWLFNAYVKEQYSPSSVSSSSWPELKLSAYDCKGDKKYQDHYTISPAREERFPFESGLRDAIERFLRDHRQTIR
jgi:Trypsin-like peptidase domain